MPAARDDRRTALRRRVDRLVVVAAAFAFTAALASPAGASATRSNLAPRAALGGSIGLRLVDVPSAARTDPRARIYFVDQLAPGTVVHRRIEASNTTASTVDVVLYAAAATIGHGSFLGSAGHTPNDLSQWTSVQPGSLRISAGGRVSAEVTIAVPRDAAPGERYGAVWAETRSRVVGSGGVVEVSRVGIRMYIAVGPGGAPASNFTIRSLTAERSHSGQPIVVASVHNSGGRALDMNGTLRLSDGPAGLSAGPFPVALGVTLAIGDTEPVTVALDKQIPAGPWDARLTLHSGLLVRNARATITFPSAGTSAAVDATPDRAARSLRGVAGVTVVLLAIAAVSVFGFRRLRRLPHHGLLSRVPSP
jgi:hypothetical protein